MPPRKAGEDLSTTIGTELRSVLQEFSCALRERYGPRFIGLWLYGSHARGETHPDSDVDLLLILQDVSRPSREIDRIADLIADVNIRHGVLLSVLPVTERMLKTGDGPFWRNVRRDGAAA